MNNLKKTILLVAFALPIFLVSAPSCFAETSTHASHESSTQPILIENAWYRAVLPGQKSTAVYFKATNVMKNSASIDSVEIEGAHHVMMHESYDDAGISKMRHVDQVTIEPRQTTSFRPGGLHVMVMGVSDELRQLEKIKVILNLSNGSQQSFFADRRQP